MSHFAHVFFRVSQGPLARIVEISQSQAQPQGCHLCCLSYEEYNFCHKQEKKVSEICQKAFST